jgi:hypothetical protein
VIDDVRPILAEPSFREKYNLSKAEIDLLTTAIQTEKIPEDSKLRKKYFKTRRAVMALSISEMQLDSGNARFEINIPEDRRQYAGTWQITGASMSGKTHFFRSLCERNWSLPKNKRRPLLMISTEENLDKTLRPLKKRRYDTLYTGVDVSENAYDDFRENEQGGSPEDFFKKRVKLVLNNVEPNTMVCFDDWEDSPAFMYLQKELDRLVRVGRHKSISPVFALNHRILSGALGKQLGNSVRWRILFGRSSKYKIISWLNFHLNMSLPEAKALLHRIIPDSRWLAVHMHSPFFVCSEKYISLL